MKKLLLTLFIIQYSLSIAQAQYAYKIAKLKYNGGGDWYVNKTSLQNLIKFANANLRMNIFPEEDIVEPVNHPVYQQRFKFATGLPKVHEHDGKAPQGFGLIYQGRLVCFYSYECDLGNGWEDQSVHNDPEPVRQQALRMGANLLQYATTTN